jgi:hypothetical protein
VGQLKDSGANQDEFMLLLSLPRQQDLLSI